MKTLCGKLIVVHFVVGVSVLASMARPAVGAIGIVAIQNPSFGLLLAGASGRNFRLNTSDIISGSSAIDAVSGSFAGVWTITDDTSPSAFSILIDAITTTGNIAVNQVLCSYNSAAQTRCDGSSISVTSQGSTSLKIGIDISTTGSHTGGDSSSAAMTLTIAYE